MKNILLIFLMGSFLFYSNESYSGKVNNDQAGGQTSSQAIRIYSSPEVAELTAALVEACRQSHPGLSFTFSNDAGDINEGSVCFFTDSHPLLPAENLKEKILIGHEIIVPVMNEKNPLAGRLKAQGLKADNFSSLLSAGAMWPSQVAEGKEVPVRVYLADDTRLADCLADFCGMEKGSIAATKLKAPGELVSAVQKDVYALGFCRLADVLNEGKSGFADQLLIVPIDKNRNGRLDGFENIYASPEELTRGVWIGKYPRKLSSAVYAASTSVSYNEDSRHLMEWVLEDGQEVLVTLGYSNLLTREKTAGMQVLNPVPPSDITTPVPFVPAGWIIGISIAVFVFLVYVVVRASLSRKTGIRSQDIAITAALNDASIQGPAGLFYDKTHTWAFMEKDGLVRIGIDDFIQHVTGLLSQVKMKAPGQKVRKGEKIVTLIREGKQLDLYSPVTGIIKANNKALLSAPSMVNSDPYASGWLYQVAPSNWLRETKFMFMAGAFRDWIEDEFVRLKDFLAASANANALVYNHIVLQDGGELTDHVLANMEPEVWEDFQTNFIDVSR